MPVLATSPTGKRICQTEVMMLLLPKGEEGMKRCQTAKHIRTLAVWTGKDTKDNVQNNMTRFC